MGHRNAALVEDDGFLAGLGVADEDFWLVFEFDDVCRQQVGCVMARRFTQGFFGIWKCGLDHQYVQAVMTIERIP